MRSIIYPSRFPDWFSSMIFWYQNWLIEFPLHRSIFIFFLAFKKFNFFNQFNNANYSSLQIEEYQKWNLRWEPKLEAPTSSAHKEVRGWFGCNAQYSWAIHGPVIHRRKWKWSRVMKRWMIYFMYIFFLNTPI